VITRYINILLYYIRGATIMNQNNERGNKELDKAVECFMKRNGIPNDTEEMPVKNFKRKMGGFISNNLISDKEEIRNFFIDTLRDEFIYYTRDSFKKFFHETFIKIEEALDESIDTINECYISRISDRDASVYNSSDDLLPLFREVAGLDKSFIFSFHDVVNLQFEHKHELDKIKKRNKQSKKNNEFETKENERYSKKINEIAQRTRDDFKGKKYLILVDDFCGSGTTVTNYINTINPVLPEHVIIIFICVHVMEKAENKIEELSSKLKREIRVYSSNKSQGSKMGLFLNKEIEEHILNFEKNIDVDFALGYKKSKALVANFDNCPNNTLCSFWFSDNEKWKPLFRRAQKQKKTKKTNEEKTEYIRKIMYTLTKKGVDKKELRIFIVLIMVKEMKNASSLDIQLELKDKFIYNENKLQECCDLKYLEEVSDDGILYTYSLTQSGRNKLKEFNLLHSKLDDLFEKSNF